nr:amino acid adenylation domain-containing protein [Streptomyces sp. SID13031]
MTPGQEGMFFHALYTPDSPAYLNQLTIRLEGVLDPERLRQAWQAGVQRHDSLRSCFRWEGLEHPLQVVVRDLTADWQTVDLVGESPQIVEEWLADDRNHGLDLARPGLHRASLLQTGPNEWLFVLTIHHLVIDGWSLGVLFQEIFRFYRDNEFQATAATGFHTYSEWVAGRDAAETEAFWTRELAGFTECSYLGIDRRLLSTDWRTGFADSEFRVTLPPDRTAALESWARRQKVTVSSVLHAAYLLLLHRLTGSRDLVYGVTMAGRPADLEDVSQIVGNFVNVLPVRVFVDDSLSPTAWVRQVQDKISAVGVFQHSSLAQVQRWSDLPVGEPIFSTFVTVENYPFDRSLGSPDPALRLSEARAYDRTVYPLNLTVVPGESLQLRFVFDTGRFAAADIAWAADQLTELLDSLIGADAEACVGALLHATRIRRPITSQPTPSRPLVSVLASFDAAVLRSPNAVALRHGDDLQTFAELDAGASLIAAALHGRGIGAGCRVAVTLDHEPGLLESIIGVMRAGAAFVPVDHRAADQRVDRILQTAAVDLMIVSSAADPIRGVTPATLRREGEKLPARALPLPDIDLDSTAYLLFTSGSTGEPKGVVVSHRSLANYLDWSVETYLCFGAGGAPLYSSIGFDLTITSLFAPLAAGRPVDLISSRQGIDGVAELLAQGRSFDFVKVTPSHLRMLVAACEARPPQGQISCLVVGGEQLPEDVVRAWWAISPQTVVLNEYGPTEATVGCCVHEVKAEQDLAGRIPIGTAIPGAVLHVLDERGDAVVDGVTGELFIGGVCLADGYFGRADLTEQRFGPGGDTDAPTRLYRTGDLVRKLPSGDLVYLGRNDDQLKVRGYRIEPAEIETALRRDPQVKDCLVGRWQRAVDDERLVGYVVPDPEAVWSALIERLTTNLAVQLPLHMVPDHFVRIDAVPQTVNGKIDRGSLPQPELSADRGHQAENIAPRDVVELRVAVIWKGLLGLDVIDVRTPFFELGGHSILAVRMMAQLKKAFGRALPLSSLLGGGTIETIAAMLRSDGEIEWTSLVPIQPSGDRQASFWVHAAGGNVLSYVPIAERIGSDFPMYGLQARGLERDQEPIGDLQRMASTYTEAIRTQQPAGPYIVAGWSFGGMVALEIANQLIDLGEEVAELIMVDTGTNDASPRTMDPQDPAFLSGVAQFISNGHVAGLSAAELSAVAPDDRVNHVVELGRSAGTLPPGFEVADLDRFLAVYAACNEAYRAYRPRQLPPRTTLVRAEQNPDPDPQLGWSMPAGGRLRVIDAPGNHVTVMNGSNIEAFAPELAKTLVEASQWCDSI